MGGQSWAQVMSPSTLPMPNIQQFEPYGAGPRTPQTPQTTGPPSVASSYGGHVNGAGPPTSYETQGSNPAFPPSNTPDIISSLSNMNVVSPAMLGTDMNGVPVPSPLTAHPNSVDNASQRHAGTPGTPQCPASVGAIANPLTPQSVGVQQQASCPGTPGSVPPGSVPPGSVGVIVGPPSVSTSQQTITSPAAISSQSQQQCTSTNSSSTSTTTSSTSATTTSFASASNTQDVSALPGASAASTAGGGGGSELGPVFDELSFDADAIINGTGQQDLDVSISFHSI